MKTENMKTKNTRSLAASLAIGFFGLSVFVLLLSSSLQIVLNIRTQQTAITNKQQLIAQEASKTVSSFIQDKFAALETAVDFANPILASTDNRKSILESMLGIHPAFRQFALLSKDGNELEQVSRISQGLSPQFSAQLVSDVASQTSHNQRYLSSVYIDDATSEPLIAIGIPVKAVLGEFQGTLIAEVNLKFMWDLVDQLQVGKTGYAYVVDNQGTLIAYRDTALVLQGKNVSQIGEVNNFVKNPSALGDVTPNIVTYTGLNGDRVVGTYIPLGTPQWAVVIELPWREAYQDAISLIFWSVLVILVIAILASLVGVYSARQTAAPLVELSNIATQVAQGNLSVHANEIGSSELVQLANSFNNMTAQLRDSISNLEGRVAERTADVELARLLSERRAQDLQSISEVSRTISTEQRLEILLPLVTRLVSERFDFYHVGIFFVDRTRQFAVFQAANSEGGKKMMARGHRLEVGLTSIVGTVSQTGKPRIALDVGADATYFDNPDLPETRSEMALPLNFRGETIGVLDVQSLRPGAFTESDASTLSVLADQIAIAIENARLFGQTEQAREEAESLYNQFLRTEWKTFLQQEATIGYHQSIIGGKPIDKLVDSADIREALRKGTVVVADGNNLDLHSALSIPVRLRGQTIGVLNIKAPTKTRKWNQDEINLAQAISDRLALALDNARLLQESQRRAVKEAKIGEVTTKIGASINMRNVLQTAVEELGRALPGSEVIIQFQDSQEN